MRNQPPESPHQRKSYLIYQTNIINIIFWGISPESPAVGIHHPVNVLQLVIQPIPDLHYSKSRSITVERLAADKPPMKPAMHSHQKRTFKTIFLMTVIALLVLPAVTTFNEILTSLVMQVKLYRLIQDAIVPFQARMISVVLRLFGLVVFPTPTGVVLGQARSIGDSITISWNCIGWQSFFLLVLTLATGLQGSYTLLTRLQTIVIGFLGTFLMNIARISIVVLVAHYVSRPAGVIFHDYVSTLATVAWLFVYWWFVFAFVLEERTPITDRVAVKV